MGATGYREEDRREGVKRELFTDLHLGLGKSWDGVRKSWDVVASGICLLVLRSVGDLGV